jgi:hypothetical protein
METSSKNSRSDNELFNSDIKGDIIISNTLKLLGIEDSELEILVNISNLFHISLEELIYNIIKQEITKLNSISKRISW